MLSTPFNFIYFLFIMKKFIILIFCIIAMLCMLAISIYQNTPNNPAATAKTKAHPPYQPDNLNWLISHPCHLIPKSTNLSSINPNAKCTPYTTAS